MWTWLAISAALATDPAPRDPVGFDLGLAFGRTGGVTAKAHLNLPVALEVTIAGGASSMAEPMQALAVGHVTLLMAPVSKTWEDGTVAPYAGFGPWASCAWGGGDVSVARGWRAPLGVEMRFAHAPIAVFAEAALIFEEQRPSSTASRVGIRWTF